MDNNEDKILFENEYYKLVIGEACLQEVYEGHIYKVINKDTSMVEYEDHLLPAAISVAHRAAGSLQEVEDAKKRDDTMIQVMDKTIIQ